MVAIDSSAAARSVRTLALASALLLTAATSAEAGSDDDVGGCAGTVTLRTFDEDPETYIDRLPLLEPGDRMVLAAGTYADGLPLSGIAGTAGSCIVIEGPASGAAAVFPGRDCCNTVSLEDVSYLVIRNLELAGGGQAGDGVKAESTSAAVHHVTLENLFIHGHGADQQIVGINTKCPAWNWVIRRNVIAAAGTGIYLGDSDGGAEHVGSLIEHNLVYDTRGYNLQIKHQEGRDTALGVPASARTVIRHNVFSKANNAATGDLARPNVLVGHWPLVGPGSTDVYEIYGNLFHANATDALFQGEGNVALYQNLFVNPSGMAVNVQPHNDVPRDIRVFHNTVVASGTGIRVTGGAGMPFTQRVVGNASYAATPFSLSGATMADNLSGSQAAANAVLVNPDGGLGVSGNALDLYPQAGALLDTMPVDWSGLDEFTDWDRDFNGAAHGGLRRGAYAGSGSNPGWQLALARKPDLPSAVLLVDGFESADLTGWIVGP